MSLPPLFRELTLSWPRIRDQLTHLDHPGGTMTAATTRTVRQTLTQIAGTSEEVIKDIGVVLREHLPALLAVAEWAENDPIVQAAEAAELPPGARTVIAAAITALAVEFPHTRPQAATQPPAQQDTAEPITTPQDASQPQPEASEPVEPEEPATQDFSLTEGPRNPATQEGPKAT